MISLSPLVFGMTVGDEEQVPGLEAARAVAERSPDVSELLALRTYTARLLGSRPVARPSRWGKHQREGVGEKRLR